MPLFWKNYPSQDTPVDASRLSEMMSVLPGKRDHFIESDGSKVFVVAGTKIALQGSTGFWKAFTFPEDTEAHLDAGAFSVGVDYFIYITIDGQLVISANSTAPADTNPADVRKIGGFHYGRVRPVFTLPMRH